jgi:dTDP-glucose 4,6-dehydratase
MTMAYHRAHGIDTRIVRIFNTYGPRLAPGDGRAIPNFISQALKGDALTIYGDGSQTRSFCYIDDLVAGLAALIDRGDADPVNLGNPDERTILELAERVIDVTGSTSGIAHQPLPVDDPKVRCPDISLARRSLGWAPTVGLDEGLERTVEWFRSSVV